MTLYWIRGRQSNRPSVLTYLGNHTQINDTARRIFNGEIPKYFRQETKKFDPKNDVLLWSDEQILLSGFHHDELQEESDE